MTLFAPSGYFIAHDLDGHIIDETDTIMCCHCGRHWALRPGSKNVRGWCGRCAGFFCGPNCQKCVPYEQQLTNMEAGKDRLWLPTDV